MFILWNETDGILASPDSFKTHREARAFVRAFRKRFERQGYYLTAGRERIPVASVVLEIIESRMTE